MIMTKYILWTKEMLRNQHSIYSENIEDKENYKKLSETLYNMFMEQHQKIMQMFKS